MKTFDYIRATTADDAVQHLADKPAGRFLAGGTNLLDLMKGDIESASDLVDLTWIGLSEIKENPDKGLSLGALATNSDTANHPLVKKGYPLLSKAVFAGATAQLRNMATNGGNILQRTRCPYFYDTAMPCNKRNPGSGCGALEGLNRTHAIFGASQHCVAVHPSDMAIALAALEAKIRVKATGGSERIIEFQDFHRLPEDKPQFDNSLKPGELIVSIELPPPRFEKYSYYLKVRDRASYAFALVSVGVGMEMDQNTIKDVRIALGGVAHKPWRALKAEQFLRGKAANDRNFTEAADAEMVAAKPLEHNAYKVELARRAIIRALQQSIAAA